MSAILDLCRRVANKQYHYLYVMLALTLLYLVLFNQTFWHRAWVQQVLDSDLPWSFKLLAPLAIALLFLTVFISLFSYKYVLKPAFIFLFITGSMIAYSVDRLGVMYDRVMMQNFMETNTSEAFAYINVSSIGYFLLLGVLPSILVWKIKIRYPRFVWSQVQRVGAVVLCFVMCLGIVLPNYQRFAFIGRQNKAVLKVLLPSSYLVAASQHVYTTYIEEPITFVPLGQDAKIQSTTSKPKLSFLVLGETARAANYSYMGYKRPTNQYTQPWQLLNFAKVFSCGTSTAHSVPCMFSLYTRANYKDKEARAQDSIMDVLNKAGIATVWYENDSGCKGACDRIKNITIDPKKHPQYCTITAGGGTALTKYC